MKPEIEMLVMVFIAVLIVVLASALGGCATKTVYVPSACPKPSLPAPPTDYMAELKPGTPAPNFVRACLLTRVSAISAYQQCAHVCGGYQ